MKTTLKPALALLGLVLYCGITVAAQNLDNLPVITVSGTAEVLVEPDVVIYSLDVTKTDKDLQVAKRLNDEAVSKVLNLTRRFSIAPQNVKTDYISVEMKYESVRNPQRRVFDEDGDEIGTRVFRGYEVSKTVIVKSTDISRFEEFFSEVLKTGITEVTSVKFETSKLRENKDKARDLAMRAAREKAMAMAASVGQVIGKALKITEVNLASPPYSQNVSNNISVGRSSSESLATFAPGAIKIEAQVTVSFHLL